MKSFSYRYKNEEEKMNIIQTTVLDWIFEPSCKTLIINFLLKYKDQFFKAVGSSRHHHNYPGGAFDHAIEVLNIASDIAENFETYDRTFDEELYKEYQEQGLINTDILYTSAFLHDISDILHYEKAPPLKTMINKLDENGKPIKGDDGKNIKVPKQPKYPFQRNEYSHTIGHFGDTLIIINQLVQGTNMPYYILDGINHCIAAHHGDYGSLVPPKTPEAWIVHLADMASAKVGGDE